MNKQSVHLIKQDFATIAQEQPKLILCYDREIPVSIKGNYKVLDNLKNVQGDFDIMVVIPRKYPLGFPTLQEVSNKIPRLPSRHINEKGIACVELTHKAILRGNHGITLSDFFQQYVHRYFCWQLVYEHDKGNEHLEEWAHGDDAVIHFYRDIFRTDDCNSIIALLRAAIQKKTLSLNQRCPCNSGKLFKRCHVLPYKTVMQIGSGQLSNDIRVLTLYMQKTC